ncbi:MAG: CPBP family intramembrane metalloprotease [Planctomycetes bacterium]|nr:CPBP family intramembrane metalloprotease [Planctomycetota bacterium]
MAQTTPTDQDISDQPSLVESDPALDNQQKKTTLAETVMQLGLSAIGAGVIIWGVWFLVKRPRWLSLNRQTVPLPVPVGLVITGYYLLLTLLPLLLVNAADLQIEDATLQETATNLIATAVILLPLAIIWVVSVKQARQSAPLDTRTESRQSPKQVMGVKRSILIAVIGFGLLYPVMSLVNVVFGLLTMLLTEYSAPRVAHDTLSVLHSSGGLDLWTGIIVAFAVIVAPIVEETVYRGTFQTLIGRLGLGPWATIIPVALLFGLSHFDIAAPIVLPSLVVLGVALGIAYECTGRLLVPIIIHALYNATQLTLLLILTRSGALS